MSLVEDDAGTREVTRDALRTLGASVECAEDAAAALKWLRSARFDLLVCDIGTAGIDGYKLMERIRASDDPQIAKLRAIALTTFAMRRVELPLSVLCAGRAMATVSQIVANGALRSGNALVCNQQDCVLQRQKMKR